MNLSADMLGALVPIVSTIAGIGMPIAIVFIVMHFRFRHRELAADLEARKLWSEKERALLEARVARLENALFQRGATPALPDRSLMEAPPASAAAAAAQYRDPLAQK
jgi:hypothetical protein